MTAKKHTQPLQPVPDGTMVRVKFKDGTVTHRLSQHISWYIHNSPRDVDEWEISPVAQPVKPC